MLAMACRCTKAVSAGPRSPTAPPRLSKATPASCALATWRPARTCSSTLAIPLLQHRGRCCRWLSTDTSQGLEVAWLEGGAPSLEQHRRLIRVRPVRDARRFGPNHAQERVEVHLDVPGRADPRAGHGHVPTAGARQDRQVQRRPQAPIGVWRPVLPCVQDLCGGHLAEPHEEGVDDWRGADRHDERGYGAKGSTTPPRSAQNRSGLLLASACTTRPSPRTTSAPRSWSLVRPQARDSTPRPPPSARPATPTEGHDPPGMPTPDLATSAGDRPSYRGLYPCATAVNPFCPDTNR
jgi:hypothetical protein